MRESDMNSPALGEEAIFKVACQIPTQEGREAYLQQVCANDSELRGRLEVLLEAYLSQPSFLEPSGAPVDCTIDLSSFDVKAGMEIGQYKLREQLGEGGMGVVYVAEQSKPVRRKVALKIIKPGLSNKEVLARFEAERQALALMDHPNIARIIDGGMTDSGLPFFVMELVQGLPLTKYCDQKRLTTSTRLELFAKVCRAVQHAHQKGIIHRDLKPSNVLVAEIDGEAIPKVIDFGVAKAVSQKLSEETVYTQLSQMVGTPLYMSPEQAGLGVIDIDTRSDVYSLSVLLYELLTGSLPFDQKTLKEKGLDEFRRVLREEEPRRPSAAISTLNAETLSTISSQRSCDPHRLTEALRGELDWIVMKALEKDRARRYATANDFADDIQRYLDGDAIEAHPPSRSYRIKKFLHKNKGPVLAGALVLMALVIGIVGTAFGFLRADTYRQTAEYQRDRAIDAEKEANNRATDLEAKARELNQVVDFQEGVIDSLEPAEAGQWLREAMLVAVKDSLEYTGISKQDRSELLSVLEDSWQRINVTDLGSRFVDQVILGPANSTIDEHFEDQPQVAATLREALAQRYEAIGMLDVAASLQQQAFDVFQDELGPQRRETLNALTNLGVMHHQNGDDQLAEEMLRAALEDKRQVLGESDVDTIRSLLNLASFLNESESRDEAEELAEEAWELSEQHLGEEHPVTLSVIAGLGRILQGQGRLAEAEELLRLAFEARQRTLGENDRYTLYSLQNLASVLIAQKKLDEAKQYCELCLQKFPNAFGEFHRDTIIAYETMGRLLERQGFKSDAADYYRTAFERRKAGFGTTHPGTFETLIRLGRWLWLTKQYDDAEKVFREAKEGCVDAFGRDHPNTLKATEGLVTMLLMQQKLDGVKQLCQEAIQTLEKKLQSSLPPDQRKGLSVALGNFYFNLGESCLRTSEFQEGLAAHEQALEVNPNQGSPRIAWIAEAYLDAVPPEYRDFERGEHMARLALQVDPKFRNARYWLAVALFRQGKYGEAQPLFEALFDEGNDKVDQAFLGMTLYQLGEYERANELLQTSYDCSIESSLYLVLAVARSTGDAKDAAVTKDSLASFFEFVSNQIDLEKSDSEARQQAMDAGNGEDIRELSEVVRTVIEEMGTDCR